MKITQDTVVTLRYQVTDAKGALIDPGKTPMVYLHGGYDNVFPKVEAALDGQETGFQIRIALSPEDAFGERDESLVKTIPKTEFPPGVKVGGSLRGVTDDGEEHAFRVVKIKGPEVLLDGNHPLALAAIAVRAAGLQPAGLAGTGSLHHARAQRAAGTRPARHAAGGSQLPQ